MLDDATESRSENGARGTGQMLPGGDPIRRAGFPWAAHRGWERLPWRLEEPHCHPDVTGDRWLLGLISAMVEQIESGEWYGSAELLIQFLVNKLGPLPPCLARPDDLLAALHRAAPMLQAWGYEIRIVPHPDWGEAVLIDGSLGRVPE